jgi:hypothetical protein
MGLLLWVFGGWGYDPRCDPKAFCFAFALPLLWFTLRCDHAVFGFGFAFTLLKPAAGETPLDAAYYCFRIHSWILGDFAKLRAWQQRAKRKALKVLSALSE